MAKNVDTVSELIGDWGPWQRRTVILIYLCKIPSAWFMACIIFTAPVPKPGEVSCYQPESKSVFTQNTWTESQNSWTEPQSIGQKDVISTDFCMKLNSTYDDAEDGNKYVPCTSFEFDTPFETTITKFNLVCSRAILISTSQFFHLFGVITGGILATKLMEQ